MTNARRPRGYVGRDHQTIGSDILSVVGVHEQMLGEALSARVGAVKADEWYPIALLLELMDALEDSVGSNGLRQMGRRLFQLSHAEHLKRVAKSAADVIYGLDEIYKRANRGEEIGGWTMLSFRPGLARLEKNTPHHCMLEEGIVSEALNAIGVPASVVQETCFRRGDESCVFVVTAATAADKWGTAR